MKIEKPIIILALCTALSMPIIMLRDSTSSQMDYYKYADSLGLIEIIDSNDLTLSMLQNRNGKLVIERVIGVVTDAETGKGNVLFNSNYYISYADVPDIANGNVICTYLIYNPDTNYEDDIIARFDYIIDNK